MKSAIETRINVVLSDEVEYEEELADLGLKDQGADAVMAFWQGPKEKYIMKEDFDVDAVVEFVEVSCEYYKYCSGFEFIFLL